MNQKIPQYQDHRYAVNNASYMPDTGGGGCIDGEEDEEDPPLAHSSAVISDDSFELDVSSIDGRAGHQSTAVPTAYAVPPVAPLYALDVAAIAALRARSVDGQHRSIASSVQYGSVQSIHSAKEKTYFYKYATTNDQPDGQPDENVERGNWSGRFDFILSALGMAVGLGNVWRFPYLCYRNGGGAFLIPYVIMLIFVGIPLFFLEMSLGQFCSSSALTCWKFAPLFKGIGIAQIIMVALFAIYYNVIMGWSLYYLIASLTNKLPWSTCDNEWNTAACFVSSDWLNVVCGGGGSNAYPNGTCFSEHGTFLGIWNYSALYTSLGKPVLPSQEFYDHRVLEMTSGIERTGSLRWQILLALFVAWLLTFICLIKGIKSSGKVVYFTALFPYAILFILFIRGVTLPHAGEGILYYLRPEWHRLGDAKVWYDAAVQIFFSLGLSYGSLTTLASYNRFHNNCLRDALIVSVCNCATSVFAGLVVFSFLGYLAGELHSDIGTVAVSGPGLAFVLYPAAVARLSGATFWSIAFFIMLLTLGLDSQFAGIEMICSSIVDQLPHLRPAKVKVTLFTCCFLFFMGIPMCTQSGVYWLQLLDTYAGGWGIMLIGLLECVALAWVYGSVRMYEDIGIMIGYRPQYWWHFCWKFTAPILITFILLFSWADYSPARYGEYYVYPTWADTLGWLMSFCSVIWIPIVAVYKISREEGTLWEKIRYLALPTEEWGPVLVQHRRLVTYVDGFIVDPWQREATHREKLAALHTWGMNASLAAGLPPSAGDYDDIGVIGGEWNPSYRAPSVGSVDLLPAQSSINPSIGGSQMSIGGMSTMSFESIV